MDPSFCHHTFAWWFKPPGRASTSRGSDRKVPQKRSNKHGGTTVAFSTGSSLDGVKHGGALADAAARARTGDKGGVLCFSLEVENHCAGVAFWGGGYTAWNSRWQRKHDPIGRPPSEDQTDPNRGSTPHNHMLGLGQASHCAEVCGGESRCRSGGRDEVQDLIPGPTKGMALTPNWAPWYIDTHPQLFGQV